MHMANVLHAWDDVKYMKVRIVVLAEAYQYYQTDEQTQQEWEQLMSQGTIANLIEQQYIDEATADLTAAEQVCPAGKRMPLFGGDTSNRAESEQSVGIAVEIRTSPPPDAFAKWLRTWLKPPATNGRDTAILAVQPSWRQLRSNVGEKCFQHVEPKVWD